VADEESGHGQYETPRPAQGDTREATRALSPPKADFHYSSANLRASAVNHDVHRSETSGSRAKIQLLLWIPAYAGMTIGGGRYATLDCIVVNKVKVLRGCEPERDLPRSAQSAQRNVNGKALFASGASSIA